MDLPQGVPWVYGEYRPAYLHAEALISAQNKTLYTHHPSIYQSKIE